MFDKSLRFVFKKLTNDIMIFNIILKCFPKPEEGRKITWAKEPVITWIGLVLNQIYRCYDTHKLVEGRKEGIVAQKSSWDKWREVAHWWREMKEFGLSLQRDIVRIKRKDTKCAKQLMIRTLYFKSRRYNMAIGLKDLKVKRLWANSKGWSP